MKYARSFQVMTPIKGQVGAGRWFKPLIVTTNIPDAIRMAEQAALQLGFAFDGDIEVQEIRKAVVP